MKKNEETIIIERDRFDQDVSAAAIGAGVQLSVNSSFISAEPGDGHILVKYERIVPVKATENPAAKTGSVTIMMLALSGLT